VFKTDVYLPRKVFGVHLHQVFQRISVIVIEDVVHKIVKTDIIKLWGIKRILVPGMTVL